MSDISSILQNSLRIQNINSSQSENQLKTVQERLGSIRKNDSENQLKAFQEKLSSFKTNNSENQFKAFQEKLASIPSVLDENTLTKLRNGDYEITLKEYTDMNSYNTAMSVLYGNNSANKFQNTLNILTNTAEDELATAKSFVQKMKDNGMSNQTAVRTYSALKKYSLMTGFKNYNFLKTTI